MKAIVKAKKMLICDSGQACCCWCNLKNHSSFAMNVVSRVVQGILLYFSMKVKYVPCLLPLNQVTHGENRRASTADVVHGSLCYLFISKVLLGFIATFHTL